MTKSVHIVRVPDRVRVLLDLMRREVWCEVLTVALNATAGTTGSIFDRIKRMDSRVLDPSDPICRQMVLEMHHRMRDAYPDIWKLTLSHNVVEVEVSNDDIYIVMEPFTR